MLLAISKAKFPETRSTLDTNFYPSNIRIKICRILLFSVVFKNEIFYSNFRFKQFYNFVNYQKPINRLFKKKNWPLEKIFILETISSYKKRGKSNASLHAQKFYSGRFLRIKSFAIQYDWVKINHTVYILCESHFYLVILKYRNFQTTSNFSKITVLNQSHYRVRYFFYCTRCIQYV